MRIKYLFLLIFCGNFCFGQTLIQKIEGGQGKHFGSNLVVSGDYSTFATPLSITNSASHEVLFFKRDETGYIFDSSFNYVFLLRHSQLPIEYNFFKYNF